MRAEGEGPRASFDLMAGEEGERAGLRRMWHGEVERGRKWEGGDVAGKASSSGRGSAAAGEWGRVHDAKR